MLTQHLPRAWTCTAKVPLRSSNPVRNLPCSRWSDGRRHKISLNVATDDTFSTIDEEVDALAAESAQLNLEQLLAKAYRIKSLASRTGADKVIPEYQVGYFKPVHLGDEAASEATSDDRLTLGILTGQAVQPTDLKVSRVRGGLLNTLKEFKDGNLTELVGQLFSIDGTDLQGSVEMAITLRMDPEEPATMYAKATELIIRPQLAEGEDSKERLQQWLSLVSEPNVGQPGKAVDPATGVIRAQMPPSMPESTIYLVANTPDLHVLTRKNESCTLFRRVDGPGPAVLP